jgi:hypothetical protein
MADQDQDNQGAIPPKVTPFAKPEGASPVTPAVPGAPRPITVRLRPAVPAAGAPAAAAPSPRATSRVPVPEGVAAEPVAAAPGTVRLRPVAPSASAAAPAPRPPFTAPGSTQAISLVPEPGAAVTGSTQHIALTPELTAATAAAPSMQPQHPPTPGSNPLPGGPKPPSSAQVQAAKSKTSRISLDSAIGVAPMTPMGADKSEPKTIRLKRPADLTAPTGKVATAPIRQTSRIPDAAVASVAEAAPASGSVTQKKTLKIKRPGAREEGASEGASVAGEAFPDGVQMTPIGALDLPVKQESSVFTAISVFVAAVAAVVLLLLTLCLGAHAVGPNAGMNAQASAKLGGFEFFWPGRITD